MDKVFEKFPEHSDTLKVSGYDAAIQLGLDSALFPPVPEDRIYDDYHRKKSIASNAWAAVSSISYFEGAPDEYLATYGISLEDAKKLKAIMYGNQ